MSETSAEKRARLQRELEELNASDVEVDVDENDGVVADDRFVDVLRQLDEDDETAGTDDWGESFTLEPGVTFVGWFRGTDTWSGEFGETPIYLLRDREGRDVFHWGGRAQLDKKMAKAAPQPGDRIAIRRLEEAPAEDGRSPAWRVKVAVAPGGGAMTGPPSEDDFAY
jgi:hypothetical protein